MADNSSILEQYKKEFIEFMIDSKKMCEILEAIADKIQEQKDFLTELDNEIGDGDHGINMARGFAAVKEKLPDMADREVGSMLKEVGMTLVSTVGGASGPLYGTAFNEVIYLVKIYGSSKVPEPLTFRPAFKYTAGRTP